MLIDNLSSVLILYIKRFLIGSYHVTKDNRPVDFPQVLDMAPFCTVECVEVQLSISKCFFHLHFMMTILCAAAYIVIKINSYTTRGVNLR